MCHTWEAVRVAVLCGVFTSSSKVSFHWFATHVIQQLQYVICISAICTFSSLLIMLETFTSYKGGVSCSAIQLQ